MARDSRIPDATGPTNAFANARAIAEAAAEAGFDWHDALGPIGKVEEELNEVRAALAARAAATSPTGRDAAHEALEGELGDLLFAALNVCRLTGISPESAIASCNARFVRRFRHMESSGLPEVGRLDDVAQWDRLWQEAKRKEDF